MRTSSRVSEQYPVQQMFQQAPDDTIEPSVLPCQSYQQSIKHLKKMQSNKRSMNHEMSRNNILKYHDISWITDLQSTLPSLPTESWSYQRRLPKLSQNPPLVCSDSCDPIKPADSWNCRVPWVWDSQFGNHLGRLGIVLYREIQFLVQIFVVCGICSSHTVLNEMWGSVSEMSSHCHEHMSVLFPSSGSKCFISILFHDTMFWSLVDTQRFEFCQKGKRWTAPASAHKSDRSLVLFKTSV